MNPARSSGASVPARPLRISRDVAAVVDVMAVHRATFAKLIANELDGLIVDFLEDAAATYQLLARRLRDGGGL
jgi:hypothetical protein